tara:strand:+ start:255 stop:626 length:372 start_codon:yes stop_codon:yes gene_type:complete
MGYMGLDSWIESDNAADTFHGLITILVENLKTRIDNSDWDNCYNTNGIVDAGLILEALFVGNEKAKGAVEFHTGFQEFLKELIDKLTTGLEEMTKEDDWGSKQMHVTAYERMITNLKTLQDSE